MNTKLYNRSSINYIYLFKQQILKRYFLPSALSCFARQAAMCVPFLFGILFFRYHQLWSFSLTKFRITWNIMQVVSA